jgi:hypothetical protein
MQAAILCWTTRSFTGKCSEDYMVMPWLPPKRAQRTHFLHYTQKQDMKRIYANEPTRWQRYNASLMAMLTAIKRPTPRQRGILTKHLFDWMAHAGNLSKGLPTHRRYEMSRCSFWGQETQQHINVACPHPPLTEIRCSHRRLVEDFFQMYTAPSNRPAMDYSRNGLR